MRNSLFVPVLLLAGACSGAGPDAAVQPVGQPAGTPSAVEPITEPDLDAPEPDEPAAKPAISEACATPERRQFDFWIGEWDVRDPDDKLVGHNLITAIDAGCALLEQWTSAGKTTGTSINAWHPATSKWTQHWVDTFGSLLEMQGGLEDGAMKLQGTYAKADGRTSRLRGVWTLLDDGRVRQLFEESTDDGKTWTLWFDGYYTRRAK